MINFIFIKKIKKQLRIKICSLKWQNLYETIWLLNSIHLLTGYEGNSTFIVPKVASENSWYRGDN